MPLRDCYLAPWLSRSGWYEILKKWGDLMDEYCEAARADGDLPYWYGENALTGLLCAAASWNRHPAIVEVEANRGTRTKFRFGKADAYIAIRRKWYQIEAKVKWPRSKTPRGMATALKEIRQALDYAEAQLEVAEGYEGDRGFAFCYAVPAVLVKRTERPEDGSDLPAMLYKRLKIQRRPLVGLYTPKKGIRAWLADGQGRNWVYPGVRCGASGVVIADDAAVSPPSRGLVRMSGEHQSEQSESHQEAACWRLV